jgi:hypothetical protein
MANKLFVFLGLFLLPLLLYSHPGRTDRNGGHNGPNGYHYHNSAPSSGTGSGTSNNQVTESDEYKKSIILAILNSNDSVADIRDMDGDLLADLSRYAALGPTTLLMADRTVFTFLVNTEFDRRSMAPDRFGQYMQRQNNTLQENIAKGGEVSVYRRQQSIVQLFISKL